MKLIEKIFNALMTLSTLQVTLRWFAIQLTISAAILFWMTIKNLTFNSVALFFISFAASVSIFFYNQI